MPAVFTPGSCRRFRSKVFVKLSIAGLGRISLLWKDRNTRRACGPPESRDRPGASSQSYARAARKPLAKPVRRRSPRPQVSIAASRVHSPECRFFHPPSGSRLRWSVWLRMQGANPQTRPVKTARPSAKAMTGQSNEISWIRGKVSGSRLMPIRMQAAAKANPTRPPAILNTRLSTIACRSSITACPQSKTNGNLSPPPQSSAPEEGQPDSRMRSAKHCNGNKQRAYQRARLPPPTLHARTHI